MWQRATAAPAGRRHQKVAKKRPLVAADVWDMIKRVQPYHGGQLAHAVPLEVLRWLSNVDKHRFLHEVGCIAIDLGPTLVATYTADFGLTSRTRSVSGRLCPGAVADAPFHEGNTLCSRLHPIRVKPLSFA